MIDRIRLPASGATGRWFALPFGGVMLLAWAINVPPALVSGNAGNTAVWLSIVCLPFVVSAVLSLRLGVWLKPEGLIARSWFRTITIPRTEILSCTSVPYAGWFNRGAPTSSLWELEVLQPLHYSQTLGGTIAGYKTSTRQRALVTVFAAGGVEPVIELVSSGKWREIPERPRSVARHK